MNELKRIITNEYAPRLRYKHDRNSLIKSISIIGEGNDWIEFKKRHFPKLVANRLYTLLQTLQCYGLFHNLRKEAKGYVDILDGIIQKEWNKTLETILENTQIFDLKFEETSKSGASCNSCELIEHFFDTIEKAEQASNYFELFEILKSINSFESDKVTNIIYTNSPHIKVIITFTRVGKSRNKVLHRFVIKDGLDLYDCNKLVLSSKITPELTDKHRVDNFDVENILDPLFSIFEDPCYGFM